MNQTTETPSVVPFQSKRKGGKQAPSQMSPTQVNDMTAYAASCSMGNNLEKINTLVFCLIGQVRDLKKDKTETDLGKAFHQKRIEHISNIVDMAYDFSDSGVAIFNEYCETVQSPLRK